MLRSVVLVFLSLEISQKILICNWKNTRQKQ